MRGLGIHLAKRVHVEASMLFLDQEHHSALLMWWQPICCTRLCTEYPMTSMCMPTLRGMQDLDVEVAKTVLVEASML